MKDKAPVNDTGSGLEERRDVPMSPWKLMLLCGLYGLVALLNVHVTFWLVDRFFSGSLPLRLVGAYLPHAVGIVICLVLGVVWWGGVAWRTIGVTRRGLWLAVVVCFLFWLTNNAFAYWSSMRDSGDVIANPEMKGFGWLALFINCLVTQVLGNAFLEEVFFRGFLYQQTIRLFRARSSSDRAFSAFGWAMLAAVITVPIFVAIHIPIRLHFGVTGDALVANLIRVGIWGFVFTGIFAASKNIWLVIGIHSITNRRCLLFETPENVREFELLLCIVLIGLLFAVRLLRRRPQSE